MATKIKIPKRKNKWTDEELEAWMVAHPEGTRVRFWPMRGYDDEFEDAEIRSEVWRLGHGDPIVKITGRAGGVALDHLCKLEQS